MEIEFESDWVTRDRKIRIIKSFTGTMKEFKEILNIIQLERRIK